MIQICENKNKYFLKNYDLSIITTFQHNKFNIKIFTVRIIYVKNILRIWKESTVSFDLQRWVMVENMSKTYRTENCALDNEHNLGIFGHLLDAKLEVIIKVEILEINKHILIGGIALMIFPFSIFRSSALNYIKASVIKPSVLWKYVTLMSILRFFSIYLIFWMRYIYKIPKPLLLWVILINDVTGGCAGLTVNFAIKYFIIFTISFRTLAFALKTLFII